MSALYPQSVHVTSKKLLKALNCLLVENFTIQDKTLLEKLLTSLQNADVLLKTIPTSTHCKWFANVLDLYQLHKSQFKKPLMHLYAFALKYLAILVKCSDILVELIETHTIRLIINKLEIKDNLKESSIFNAYMTLLQSLNTHKQGVEYVFQEGLWECILFAIHGLLVPAKYIEIQSSEYIADLIYISFEYKIEQSCEPLLSELFFNIDIMNRNIIANQLVEKKDLILHRVYVKTLILTLEKFVGTLYESDLLQKIIVKHCLSHILKNIKKLFDIHPILLKHYIKLHFLFDYFTVWNQCANQCATQCILKSIFSYMNTSKETHIYKKISNLYIQVIRYAHISNSTLAVDAEFEKELIIGQLIPLKKCTEWLKCSKYQKFDCGNIIESKYILYHCNNHDSVMNEMAISSILNILDIVPILKQGTLDYIVIFFSKLFSQFLNSNGWLNENLDQDSTNKKFLEILSYVVLCWTKILECKLFIENKKDSSFMPFFQDHNEFFHKPCHNTSLLQNSLNLINAAINTIIGKNMVDTFLDLDLLRLCDTLNDLLLDPRPEIRDSCLQCISSIVAVSKSKLGHHRIKIILEKNFPTAVLNTLQYDNDPFVRCKALECLENMVSVLDIWESSLKESDLIAHCINLMEYESEGIIRRQVVKLITALFFNNELSYELCNVICIVMVHVSTKDPLWEVKTFTYDFWDLVIQNMIRKYCKMSENQKLTNNNFVLRELSSIGCLHVFYVALKEEHDLVVQKKAIYLTKKILDTVNLTDFKLMNEPVNCSNSIDIVLQNVNGPKQKKSRQIDSADRVLSSITTSHDCELLSNLKIDHNDGIYPYGTCLRLKTDVYISIEDFLNFTSTYDFDNCDAKTQWIISTRSGLDSMLDDIIGQSLNCFIDGADLLDCH